MGGVGYILMYIKLVSGHQGTGPIALADNFFLNLLGDGSGTDGIEVVGVVNTKVKFHGGKLLGLIC